MKSDKFGNVIYENKDIVELIYTDKANDIGEILVEDSEEIKKLEEFSNLKIKKIDQFIYDKTIKDFDYERQSKWLMPDEYKNLDIETFLVQHSKKEYYDRLIEELQEYRKRNLIPMLRWLKYVIDTCRKNNIVWGVGRGSSVSSYVLYIIGVHKIDPVKYQLDWKDFLR